MPVVLDTNLLFAFLVAEDEHHAEAQSAMRDISEGKRGTPVILDLIVSELFTLMRVRRTGPESEAAAARLLFDPQSAIPRLRLWSLSTGRLSDVARVFVAYRSTGLSYADAALLVLSDDLGGAEIASFDGRLMAVRSGEGRPK